MSALRNPALDAPGILREVARATWAKAHDGAECPDNRSAHHGRPGRVACRVGVPGS